jgi:hypothetical protein
MKNYIFYRNATGNPVASLEIKLLSMLSMISCVTAFSNHFDHEAVVWNPLYREVSVEKVKSFIIFLNRNPLNSESIKFMNDYRLYDDGTYPQQLISHLFDENGCKDRAILGSFV